MVNHHCFLWCGADDNWICFIFWIMPWNELSKRMDGVVSSNIQQGGPHRAAPFGICFIKQFGVKYSSWYMWRQNSGDWDHRYGGPPHGSAIGETSQKDWKHWPSTHGEWVLWLQCVPLICLSNPFHLQLMWRGFPAEVGLTLMFMINPPRSSVFWDHFKTWDQNLTESKTRVGRTKGKCG